jgi:PPM family protein phosphatase
MVFSGISIEPCLRPWKNTFMEQVKDTRRALVRIGFDGRVSKTFRGHQARERFENERLVLDYLEKRGCDFVPRVLEHDAEKLLLVTSNGGSRVEHLSEQKMTALFQELEHFGVRHEDQALRNVTYHQKAGRFFIIDFEFATLLEEPSHRSPNRPAPPSPIKAPLSRSPFSLSWAALTHCGKIRQNNEDAFLALTFDSLGVRFLGKEGEGSLNEGDYVFAVSDGMGGAKAGEFASRITVEKITKLLPQNFNQQSDNLEKNQATLLTKLFHETHHALTYLGTTYEECAGMGATLSLCWFGPEQMYFGHIGDSRIYHLPQAGGLKQLSHDDSHVGWLLRNHKINEREARAHPLKNSLQKALGAGHQFVDPQLGSVSYQKGDLFLICSDGVIDGLWDKQIFQLLREPEEKERQQTATLRLVERALENSGRDNITALVIHLT